jgi:hypothetical protein
MRKKDGESEKDGCLPIPCPDIWDSISYLTGGGVRPMANDPVWLRAQARLREAGFSPFEYVYYIANHSQRLNGVKASTDVLAIRNICCSDKMWADFLTFKAGLELELDVNIRLQKEILNASARTNGMLYVLTRPYFEIGPSLRVESALQMLRIGNPEYLTVLELWGIRAGEALLGLPQIARHLPTTINALEEENPYASDHLFPRNGIR